MGSLSPTKLIAIQASVEIKNLDARGQSGCHYWYEGGVVHRPRKVVAAIAAICRAAKCVEDVQALDSTRLEIVDKLNQALTSSRVLAVQAVHLLPWIG